MAPAEAAVSFAAANFVATHTLNIRKKYKTAPIACDAQVNSWNELNKKVQTSRRYRIENPEEYQDRSDESAERREDDAIKVLERKKPSVDKARKLQKAIDNKEQGWCTRAAKRLTYDQYSASRDIKEREYLFKTIENGEVSHQRNVDGRKRQAKAAERQANAQHVQQWNDGAMLAPPTVVPGPPSLVTDVPTVDESDEEVDERSHRAPRYEIQTDDFDQSRKKRYNADYATGYEDQKPGYWKESEIPFPSEQQQFGRQREHFGRQDHSQAFAPKPRYGDEISVKRQDYVVQSYTGSPILGAVPFDEIDRFDDENGRHGYDAHFSSRFAPEIAYDDHVVQRGHAERRIDRSQGRREGSRYGRRPYI